MLLIFDFLFVFFIALLLTGLFAVGMLGYRAGGLLLAFFIILLFATWAGGIWIKPVGAPVVGVYWISFLLVGVLIALMMAALIPPARPPRTRTEMKIESEKERTVTIAFGIFFWSLIIGFIIAIIVRYIRLYGI